MSKSIISSGVATPVKPHKDYPLFAHTNGQWAKKIKGKLHYFGAHSDPDAALKKWLDSKDDLLAGRTPRAKNAGIELHAVCNAFLNAKQLLVNAGELTAYTFDDLFRVCKGLTTFFGRERAVADLRPDDWANYRATLATTQGPVTLGNSIIRTRSIFNWAAANKVINAIPEYGTGFEIPSRKAKRRVRNEARRQGNNRTFAADDLRALLNAARQPLKAMILLGINCGFGQSDVASLPVTALDLRNGWIDYPRVKTETDRRCPLWPETVEALREAIANRPKPANPEDAATVFLTMKGNRWIQQGNSTSGTYYRNDNVGKEVDKLLVKLDLKRRGSFYNLRHVFRTIGGGAKDREAIDLIMGHVDQSMAAHYVESIDDDRLRAVCNIVHQWLFGIAEEKSA